MNVFNNPWITGIGAGIISGLVVFFITNFLMKKSDNRQYLAQISSANLQVVDILKPYISDGGLPDESIIQAIINSVARKNNVSVEEMHSITIFCEELIREIVENVYISRDNQRKYIDYLKNYIESLKKPRSKKFDLEMRRLSYEYDQRKRRIISMMLSITAILVTLTMIMLYDLQNIFLIDNADTLVISIVSAVSLAITVPMIAFTIIQRKKQEEVLEKRRQAIREATLNARRTSEKK